MSGEVVVVVGGVSLVSVVVVVVLVMSDVAVVTLVTSEVPVVVRGTVSVGGESVAPFMQLVTHSK
jgi:hypothetical protein